MADRKIHPVLINRFVDKINDELKENKSLKEIIYHLIKKGILPTSRVRDYCIIADYYIWQSNAGGSTIDFAYISESTYGISDRQIFNIVKYHYRNIKRKYVNS